MRYLITGEAGFIAQNLSAKFKNRGHEVVCIDNANMLKLQSTGEACVHRNTAEQWAYHLKNLNVDTVIHNAAIVGTDVVALNPKEATLTNITGTYNIVSACNIANIPICYLGTTVIYDTSKYQNVEITEKSDLNPTTFYGVQKLAGEQVVKNHANRWTVMRPLFAFGGAGDMNSLIAKSVWSKKNGRSLIDMFLDPDKIKDYLYVNDFCEAVAIGCERGLFGRDYNIAAETPYKVADIMEMIEAELKMSLRSVVKWYPGTDYLGNHRLSSKKFRIETGWSPKYNLQQGIATAVEDIMSDTSGYDPLVHIDEASSKGVDLVQFFPKQQA